MRARGAGIRARRYRFTRYRKAEDKAVRLVLPEGVDGDDLRRIAEGVTLARDMVNTPANDMGPAEIETIARELAEQHGAESPSITGDELLKQNFPLIHAVGRAAEPRAPRMIDLRWGEPATQGDAGRQGRRVRHRRAGHQARRPACC